MSDEIEFATDDLSKLPPFSLCSHEKDKKDAHRLAAYYAKKHTSSTAADASGLEELEKWFNSDLATPLNREEVTTLMNTLMKAADVTPASPFASPLTLFGSTAAIETPRNPETHTEQDEVRHHA
jgi:hypothetical protein